MKNKNFGRKRQAIYILSNRKSTRIIKTLMDFFFFIKVKIKMVCFSVPSLARGSSQGLWYNKRKTVPVNIICNRDRHYNNFGMIRNVNTLQIEKAAPIFDSGTSAFAGISENKIKTLPLNESKPFCKYHEEQIALIQNIERYEFQNLIGLDEEFNELLQRLPFITVSRRDKLVTWLGERIRMLCESKMDNRKSLLDREDSKRIPEKKVR